MKNAIRGAAAVTAAVMSCCALASEAEHAQVEKEDESSVAFNAGADLRVRQELMDNVPGLPGGGLLQRAAEGPYRNQMRYRVRAWGELTAAENWRLYMRVTDEFRWNPRPRNHKTTFPDELVLDNLYLDATGLFDDFLDFRIGRQDIYGLYGLDHIFVDGTPGDGSRTVYADMARATLHFTEEEKLDLFFLHNYDDNPARWGTERGRHRSVRKGRRLASVPAVRDAEDHRALLARRRAASVHPARAPRREAHAAPHGRAHAPARGDGPGGAQRRRRLA